MTDITRTLKRLIALGLSSALIALSAGTEAYAAAGRAVEVSGAHAGPAAAPVAPVSLQLPAIGGAANALPGAGLDVHIPALPRTAATVPNGTASLPSLAPAAVNGAATGPVSLTPTKAAAANVPAQTAATQNASGQNESAVTGGASSIENAASSLEKAAPSTVAKTSRIASAIRSLKSIFGAKAAQSMAGEPTSPVAAAGGGVGTSAQPALPEAQLSASPSQGPPSAQGSSAAKAQSGGEKDQPPAPPSGSDNGGSNDDGGKGGKSWFGLGKAAASFIGALLVAQVGVEALGASMPTLVQKQFGDFTVVAQLAIFSSVASIIGRQMASVFVKKHGLRKVYLTAEIARVFSIGALIGLLITGHMTLPLMMAFYSLNGMLGGVAVTAESSIPPALVGQDNAKLERFWTVEQTLLETIGVTGPIVTGMVVASFGFVPALVAYPIALAASIGILLLTLRIPQKVEAMRLADLEKAKAEGKNPGIGSAFKEFFAKIARGTKLVWNTPALRYPFLAYTAYMALNPFLYSMIAPAYALRLVHNNAEIATSIGGWLTGLYSLGGLLGGVIMMLEQRKLDKAKKAGTMTEEQEAAALRKSLLKWMVWGTAGLLAIATLAFPSPLFFGSLTLPALALIPFGIAQVISTVKLKSFFQAKAPQKEMADAMGFFGAASLAVSTIGLLALKYVFKLSAGFTPFWYIAAAMIPLAAFYVWLTRRMAAVSKPENAK